MMKKLKVIKIGGKVIDNEELLTSFLKLFSEIDGPKILVHGGGTIASGIGRKLGLEPVMRDGRRVTDAPMLEVVSMVYGGLIAKKIVAGLQGFGTNAVALSGADLHVITAEKRPPEPVDFGWVGDITGVDTRWIARFLEEKVVPVFAPLTYDGHGNLLNTNADTIACEIASAITNIYETELYYCFEQPGVMNDGKPVTNLDKKGYAELKHQGVITGGMIPKLDLGFLALERGVRSVSIRSAGDVNKQTTGTELML